jgi:hypothetical protein
MIELDTTQIIAALICVLITGFLSGALGAYVSIKVFTNEIKWINKMLDKQDKEIDRLHDRFTSHITKFHTRKHDAPG